MDEETLFLIISNLSSALNTTSLLFQGYIRVFSPVAPVDIGKSEKLHIIGKLRHSSGIIRLPLPTRRRREAV